MNKAILLAIAACIAGCGTPVIKEVPLIVNKPIAINCIKSAPVRPSYKTESLPATASDLMYADALADDWLSSRVYESTMEAAVQACLVAPQ